MKREKDKEFEVLFKPKSKINQNMQLPKSNLITNKTNIEPSDSITKNRERNMSTDKKMNFNPMRNSYNIMPHNIQDYNNDSKNLSEQVKSLKEEIDKLKKTVNLKEEENNNLKQTIKLKEEENKELKARIDSLVNKTPVLVDYNQINVIQFISTDHSLICGIKCILSDTFAEVEEKLYKIYPDYRNTNNVFHVDGRPILRFKTIAENNIPAGHFVLITQIE